MRLAHSVTRLGDLFLSGHTGQAQNKKRLFLTYAGRRQRTCLTRAPILLSSAYDVFTTSIKICKYVQTGFSWNCNILLLNMSEFYSVDRATPVFRKNAVRIPSRLFIIFCILHFISSECIKEWPNKAFWRRTFICTGTWFNISVLKMKARYLKSIWYSRGIYL